MKNKNGIVCIEAEEEFVFLSFPRKLKESSKTLAFYIRAMDYLT
jgi:hypothetical protein